MPVTAAERADERLAVRDDVARSASPEHPQALRVGQLRRAAGRRRARARRQAGLTMIRRFGSSPSEWLVTPSIAVERVVDHLAVGRRHRVERPGDARLLDHVRHAAGELLERDPTLLPVAGDVDAQAGLVIAEPALGGDPGQVLDGQQGAPPGPISRPSPLGPS